MRVHLIGPWGWTGVISSPISSQCLLRMCIISNASTCLQGYCTSGWLTWYTCVIDVGLLQSTILEALSGVVIPVVSESRRRLIRGLNTQSDDAKRPVEAKICPSAVPASALQDPFYGLPS